MSGLPASLDAPGTACYFAANSCSTSMLGHGGFDQHHPVPIELGGSPTQPLLALCPNHHRRQHSLIRYLIECSETGAASSWDVLDHFTAPERLLATEAVDQWVEAGRPPITGWPCPAAR